MAKPRRGAYRMLHKAAKQPGDFRARCFYCGGECYHRGPDRGTIEHLVAKAHGGQRRRENMRLAHLDCNNAVANLPVDVKLTLAGSMERGEVPAWVRERFDWIANAWTPRAD